jgi:hypothetical protein
MQRHIAKQIAEKITNEQLQEMFNKAKTGIKDWTKTSSVNKGLTKGAAWNILAEKFDVNAKHHILAKTNMVREFSEFLPDELKPQKKAKMEFTPTHQIPKFLMDDSQNSV